MSDVLLVLAPYFWLVSAVRNGKHPAQRLPLPSSTARTKLSRLDRDRRTLKTAISEPSKQKRVTVAINGQLGRNVGVELKLGAVSTVLFSVVTLFHTLGLSTFRGHEFHHQYVTN